MITGHSSCSGFACERFDSGMSFDKESGEVGSCTMASQSPVLEKGFYPRAKVSILCHEKRANSGVGKRVRINMERTTVDAF